jgi:uncharacterized protein (TIGR03084 family)
MEGTPDPTGDLTGNLAGDLADEQDALDAIVADLSADQWLTPTPSPGWTVADQVGHLTYFDSAATLAMTDPDAFRAHRREMLATFGDAGAAEAMTLGAYRAMNADELLAAWRRGRLQLTAAAASVAPDTRIEWYGPSMSKRSFLTARLMEAWAHGQDVVDALGAERPPTDRLRHVAQLGVITRGWSYKNRGLDAPAGDVRVELAAPSGDMWTWGDADLDDSVTGPAEDFCLVITQRRHVDDTGLAIRGPLASDWMECAQAFAGPATSGPAARSTRT